MKEQARAHIPFFLRRCRIRMVRGILRYQGFWHISMGLVRSYCRRFRTAAAFYFKFYWQGRVLAGHLSSVDASYEYKHVLEVSLRKHAQ
jgi:hypothetical protein